MKCGGCGVVLEASDKQVNAAVGQVLDTSLADAHDNGVCPLCGYSKAVSHWNRNIVLFGLLVICGLTGIVATIHRQQRMARAAAMEFGRVSARAPRFDGTYPCVFALVSGSSAVASLGRCAMPTTHAAAIDRFEVDLRYGAFVMRQTDLHLKDNFDVPLTRSYNSEDWIGGKRVHAFGRNSNHPYDIAPLGTRNPYTYQLLALEDGDFLYFERISKGTGYADAVFQHTETSTRFYRAMTSWNGDGWTTKLTDGSEILFPESYKAKSLAQGAATEMVDGMGNKLELQRDRQRNLQKILTPQGHWIKFGYDDQARILRAEDDRGQWVMYGYNSDGMLITASDSSGHSRNYMYQGALMIGIADEHWHVLLRNWYESSVLVRQRYANGDVYEYRYRWSAKQKYAERVVITLPDRSQREVITGDSVPEYRSKD